MHRDVSEGNVMIAHGRGFLHDFDHGFNWKLFLQFLFSLFFHPFTAIFFPILLVSVWLQVQLK